MSLKGLVKSLSTGMAAKMSRYGSIVTYKPNLDAWISTEDNLEMGNSAEHRYKCRVTKNLNYAYVFHTDSNSIDDVL